MDSSGVEWSGLELKLWLMILLSHQTALLLLSIFDELISYTREGGAGVASFKFCCAPLGEDDSENF